MNCSNQNCINYDIDTTEYCDECIKEELETFTYDELSEMYAEGKELIDRIHVSPMDKEVVSVIRNYKQRWFRLINEELLRRE